MVKVNIKDMSMRYEKKYILEEMSLDIQDGELLVILGESGCGKSTLLKIIAGLIEPEKGDVLFNDINITKEPPQKRKIGYVPQAQVLFPHMTIRENIQFGLEARKLSKESVADKMNWITKLIQIDDLLDRFPREISGGQRQRVALARAMAIEPDILLLDEPLSSIDASGRESLALTIRRVQRQTGTTTVYVTHNSEEARLISDRVAIMYDGKIQQLAKYSEIDHQPKNYLVARIMGSSNVWQLLFKETNSYGDLLHLPIGKIQLKGGRKEKITGVRIKETSFSVHESEQESAKDSIIVGKIRSILDQDEESLRCIVALPENVSEYIKVEIKKENLPFKLEVNQEIILSVDSKEVILF